jgi:glutamate carboxypeptidase
LETFQRIQALGAGLGLALGHAATGGGSDGSFTAALGVPTMDGMGAIGEGAHSDHENIVIGSLVERCALNAVIIGRW